MKKVVCHVLIVEVQNVHKMKNVKYRFYYHWVRQTNKWSVHFKNKCVHAKHIKCNVPCESKINNAQPLRVMRGFAESVEFNNDILIIN